MEQQLPKGSHESAFLGVLDRFFERIVADRAAQDPVADDEQRRSGGAERPGELEILFELGLDIGAGGNLGWDSGCLAGDRY